MVLVHFLTNGKQALFRMVDLCTVVKQIKISFIKNIRTIMQKRVLLTGVTVFFGSHTTIQLLNKGYQVIGTLRNKKRTPEIRQIIAQHTDALSNSVL